MFTLSLNRFKAAPALSTKRKKGPPPLKFGAQLSCALCFSRYRTMEDFTAHKTLSTHTSRLQWREMEEWYNTEGQKFLQDKEEKEFQQFGNERGGRRSRMNFTSRFHPDVLPPKIAPPASDIVEPKDKRWPFETRAKGT